MNLQLVNCYLLSAHRIDRHNLAYFVLTLQL